MNRPLAILGLVLIIVAVFGHPILAQLSTVSCGTTNVTYTVRDGNTGALLSGVTIADSSSSVVTNSAGQATLDGLAYGTTVTMSAPNYLTFTETENYCPAVGTTINTPESINLDPTSILNIGGSSTSTFTSVATSTTTTTSTIVTTSNGTPTTSTSIVTSTISSTTTFVVGPSQAAPKSTTYEQAGLGFIGLILIGLAFVKKKGKTV